MSDATLNDLERLAPLSRSVAEAWPRLTSGQRDAWIAELLGESVEAPRRYTSDPTASARLVDELTRRGLRVLIERAEITATGQTLPCWQAIVVGKPSVAEISHESEADAIARAFVTATLAGNATGELPDGASSLFNSDRTVQ